MVLYYLLCTPFIYRVHVLMYGDDDRDDQTVKKKVFRSLCQGLIQHAMQLPKFMGIVFFCKGIHSNYPKLYINPCSFLFTIEGAYSQGPFCGVSIL